MPAALRSTRASSRPIAATIGPTRARRPFRAASSRVVRTCVRRTTVCATGRRRVSRKWKTVRCRTSVSDVSCDNWYSDAIDWAANRGLVAGIGNGYFAPSAEITREQMAIILYRFVGDLVDEIMDRNYVPLNTATRAEMAAVMLRLAKFER